MPYLPQELVILILSFLSKIHDKDKCLHFLFPEYKHLIYPQKKLLIEKYFNPKIIDLLGGINKWWNTLLSNTNTILLELTT